MLSLKLIRSPTVRTTMKAEYKFAYETYDSLSELSEMDAELVNAERNAATTKSHAPYSGYRVGAAARLDNGQIITSSNQESEVFPAGLCAERILLFTHMASGSTNKITDMAIASMPGTTECYPCGGCRQVLMDTMVRQKSPFRIIMASEHSATVVASPADLMPFAFHLKH